MSGNDKQETSPPPSPRHRHELFCPARTTDHPHLMGPLLRRKKVVSMPLGYGGDFFVSEDVGGPHRQLLMEAELHHHPHAAATQRQRQRQLSYDVHRPVARRERQLSHEAPTQAARERQVTPPTPRRMRQDSNPNQFFQGVLRRKQISLDLLGPNDFFSTPIEDEEVVQAEGEQLLQDSTQALEPLPEDQGATAALPDEAKLFRPLRFAPRMAVKRSAAGGHGSSHGSAHGSSTTEHSRLPTLMEQHTTQALDQFSRHSQSLQSELQNLQKHVDKHDTYSEISLTSQNLKRLYEQMEEDRQKLAEKVGQAATEPDTAKINGEATEEEWVSDDSIVRATRQDKISAGIVALIMLVFTIVVCTWDTHLDEESFIHKPVGLACLTPCVGDTKERDFFEGHYHFEKDEVIEFFINIDPSHHAESGDILVQIDIVSEETGEIKKTEMMGPVDPEERVSLTEKTKVNFANPEEAHILIVNSTNHDVELSFTLAAKVRSPLADSSVLIAALIMIAVYFFILIEVIHRTLVAIFGSFLALMFYFAMNSGETESIAQLMLHLEWSTLGLLFGMMLIVGELSHTGVFEWCAVRLLVASKGSFARLLVLLGTLTAVASAFLDNVTTMLLIAPVTIDMCNILEVDPRPYLIGEVLLSNVGGTATLIGDPPNLIIGSSFEEIGFVDFITNILPAIFLFCLPATLVVVVYIYRYYLFTSKMQDLDDKELKKTYPIYDEPRLMIAGTVTFFVILIFFLHSVHHADTAWVALFGAFVTISFTNPHDIQDALRNHVEWDTLLFFAGLFVLVEVCAAMGLLEAIGDELAKFIEGQPEDKQLPVAITLVMWVSAIVSAFLDNIPYTATMIPVIEILTDQLPSLDLTTMAWALSFGACLGGNGTLLGASANIVTAGIATNKGFEISFLNFLYPGMIVMVVTVGISNLYMLVRYAWI